MKKKLLLPSILLTHMLFYTACGQKQYTSDISNSQVTTASNNRSITHSSDYSSPSTQIAITPSANGTTYQLPSLQGETITIIENGNVGFDFPQYNGKIVIFEIFGKDCEYCLEETPIINRIKREFSSRVEVVAIQAQDRMTPSVASMMLSQQNMNYPVIEGDDAKNLLRFLSETYGWTGILPYVLLVKNGSTEYTFPDGGVNYEELKESIESLL